MVLITPTQVINSPTSQPPQTTKVFLSIFSDPDTSSVKILVEEIHYDNHRRSFIRYICDVIGSSLQKNNQLTDAFKSVLPDTSNGFTWFPLIKKNGNSLYILGQLTSSSPYILYEVDINSLDQKQLMTFQDNTWFDIDKSTGQVILIDIDISTKSFIKNNKKYNIQGLHNVSALNQINSIDNSIYFSTANWDATMSIYKIVNIDNENVKSVKMCDIQRNFFINQFIMSKSTVYFIGNQHTNQGEYKGLYKFDLPSVEHFTLPTPFGSFNINITYLIIFILLIAIVYYYKKEIGQKLKRLL